MPTPTCPKNPAPGNPGSPVYGEHYWVYSQEQGKMICSFCKQPKD